MNVSIFYNKAIFKAIFCSQSIIFYVHKAMFKATCIFYNKAISMFIKLCLKLWTWITFKIISKSLLLLIITNIIINYMRFWLHRVASKIF